jgi:SAM-dependent methyltransferase
MFCWIWDLPVLTRCGSCTSKISVYQCMPMPEPRPFYHRFAWAYDMLVDEPAEGRARAIAARLGVRGVSKSATLLDAGCGTGRYALELAQLGFHVVGIDRSPELIDVARGRDQVTSGRLEFQVGDFTALAPVVSFDAVLCRGVLNDLLTDAERERVVQRFAEVLKPSGVLLLDVRDWIKTARRFRSKSPRTRLVTSPNGQELRFTHETMLEPATQQMVIRETFEPHHGADAESHVTEFRMRCWSERELRQRFGPHFVDVEISPDYACPPAWNDRLVFIGTRGTSLH